MEGDLQERLSKKLNHANLPHQQKLNLSEKSQLGDKPVGSNLKLGLFSYPVLQAADILVHR